ncbi:hypothetical protein DCAR_0311736 [Daucus carota subsp. sativus]|uniref:Glycosyl transferase CAP10 domain-containing protein n=1 Tax=Daucus carota subsp. sativus TaxID=79200 RepID=A0AAF0WM43_DAUCS|nr:PREDICTED: O-glucosyltransferase rumi homolog [Daucus carota subsp. sativus]XP_017242823.1 PREDICTED: O-glucosyltransferase rumi homolog [Daucus carota subsp. sativus]WOG92467.1 hypothetical protein DCAR_0311736 [Daucus carota subsp. sativus]
MRENIKQRFHLIQGSRGVAYLKNMLSILNSNLLSSARSSSVPYYFRLSAFIFLLFFGAFISTRLLDSTLSSSPVNSPQSSIIVAKTTHDVPIAIATPAIPKSPPRRIEIPIKCSTETDNVTQKCPATYYPENFGRIDLGLLSNPPNECPEYFRWIYEDLRPWRETGITEEMVERARRTANFRLVILNGRAYVETYQKSFQSRDVFTLWGILQLLRMYPGKVPDLDLMFDCVDWPVIRSSFYRRPNATAPPPLFRYCADDSTLDIVFPDWSFWGWPEINIKSWGSLLKDLEEGNSRISWMDREPYAYWKGNPVVAETRMDLLKCNVSDKQDWNARVYAQDWGRESQQGYKQSDLASQCIHRYKIYIEGSAWSVSDKYILACDSVTLVVKPRYYDFYTRGLMPVHHYWPIKDDDKCRSIKFAVDWGNSHKQKASAIGKEASKFIQQDLKMEKVYDYMFHLLNQYAKLLKYKPVIPPKAVELCSETMACPAEGLTKKFMMESLVKGPKDGDPCVLQPPYDPATLQSVLRRKQNSIKQVERWEEQFWDNQKQNKQI